VGTCTSFRGLVKEGLRWGNQATTSRLWFCTGGKNKGQRQVIGDNGTEEEPFRLGYSNASERRVKSMICKILEAYQ
jgi:hypothetical protein